MSEFIGKFVCYDQADGGFCWGRIKDEAVVNTIHGEKEVFILTDRYVRYARTRDIRDFGRYYPNVLANPGMSRATSKEEGEEVFMETRKVRGDTTLRKEMIDLENDIIDLDDLVGAVDDDTLFKAILSAREGAKVTGVTALEVGLNSLLSDDSLSASAKGVLKRRLGME